MDASHSVGHVCSDLARLDSIPQPIRGTGFVEISGGNHQHLLRLVILQCHSAGAERIGAAFVGVGGSTT